MGTSVLSSDISTFENQTIMRKVRHKHHTSPKYILVHNTIPAEGDSVHPPDWKLLAPILEMQGPKILFTAGSNSTSFEAMVLK
jgi:hypothetical protein